MVIYRQFIHLDFINFLRIIRVLMFLICCNCDSVVPYWYTWIYIWSISIDCTMSMYIYIYVHYTYTITLDYAEPRIYCQVWCNFLRRLHHNLFSYKLDSHLHQLMFYHWTSLENIWCIFFICRTWGIMVQGTTWTMYTVNSEITSYNSGFSSLFASSTQIILFIALASGNLSSGCKNKSICACDNPHF